MQGSPIAVCSACPTQWRWNDEYSGLCDVSPFINVYICMNILSSRMVPQNGCDKGDIGPSFYFDGWILSEEAKSAASFSVRKPAMRRRYEALNAFILTPVQLCG